MEKRKINIKKALPLKQEPDVNDLLDLLEKVNPNDVVRLYFILVGVLSTRGYEFFDDGSFVGGQ